MAKSGLEPARVRDDSVQVSLAELRKAEEERLRKEAEAEQARFAEAEKRRGEAARLRHEKEEQTRREQEEGARVIKLAIEREQLLDIDRRLADQKRALQTEFYLEREHIREEVLREVKTGRRTTAVMVTVASVLVMCSTAVVAFRETVRRRAAEKSLEVMEVRVNGYEKDLQKTRAVLERTNELYLRASAENDRRLHEVAGTLTSAVHAARRTDESRNGVVRKVAPAPLAAPPSFRQTGHITVDTSEDPLGGMKH